MSSTSTLVSLPSIHEMFPEYLLKMSPSHRLGLVGNSTTLLSKSPDNLPGGPMKQQLDRHVYSFDVLRSDPSSSSLQHIASSATLPNRSSTATSQNRVHDMSNGSAPVFRVNPSSAPTTLFGIPSSSSSSSAGSSQHPALVRDASSSSYVLSHTENVSYSSEDMSDDGDDKRHVCGLCHKRFNRPSSLRIHMNTHTGATPFRCPYPNCGREFNVNSNMRRHYRNHTTAAAVAATRPQAKEDITATSSSAPIRRRRRRRGSSPIVQKSPKDDEFLVLRPDVPMHPASSYTTPGSTVVMGKQGYSTARGGGISDDGSGGESESESDHDEEEDEVVRPSFPSYRLQPVSSDFQDRYSSSRYHPQSDLRSSGMSTSSSGGSPPLTPSPISPARSSLARADRK